MITAAASKQQHIPRVHLRRAWTLTTMCLLLLVRLQAHPEEQGITLVAKQQPLISVLDEVKKQTNFVFFYNKQTLQQANKVTATFRNTPIEEALKTIFSQQPFIYSIDGKTVTISLPASKAVRETPVADNHTQMAVSPALAARKKQVRGKVLNELGEPIAGAHVQVKGEKAFNAVTDNNGEFSLDEVPDDATLVISGVNIETHEVNIGSKSSVVATVKASVRNLDESIVVAYNKSTRRSNTAAITVIAGEQIQNLPNRSVDRSLQGLVPGLLVTPGNGQPGAGVSAFVLRGISTAVSPEALSTARNPLIVVDGIPVSQESSQLYTSGSVAAISNPLAQLNPSDIESITVLRDASAVSLYGAKASNGVLLITTKRGKAGKTTFTLRHQSDWAQRQHPSLQTLNQQEYLALLYETYKNADPVKYTDDVIRKELLSRYPYTTAPAGDTSFYATPDWNKELLHSGAITISNEVSISGGNDKNNFYLNLEQTNQDGIVRATGFDRTSFRFNFENRTSSFLKWGLNTTGSYSIQQYAGASRTGLAMPFSNLISPLIPVRDNIGNLILVYRNGLNGGQTSNPVAAAMYNTNKTTSYRSLSKVYGELRWKDIKFYTALGVDFNQNEIKEKGDPRLINPANSAAPNTADAGIIEELSSRNANLINTNLLQYERALAGQHSLNITLGQEAQIVTRKDLQVSVIGLKLPYYNEITSPGVKEFKRAGLTTKETLLSYFGQVNYSFKNRYYFSGSIRRDGSSRFGEDNKFGTYWSTGLGWNVSEESFLKKNTPWLDFLKIRGSIGASGNAAAINAYTKFDQLEYSNYMGGLAVYNSSTPGNPNIKWEQTFSWNGGIDIRLLHERLQVSTDVYKRLTNNLVYAVNLPRSSGYSQVLANIGKMSNTGIEITLSAEPIRIGYFRWRLSGNWSTNKNKLTEASVPLQTLTTDLVANEVGRNFNSYYLFTWMGVNPSDGLPQWLDSAGKPTSALTSAKKEFAGKPQPDGFGSITTFFSFRGFDLSAMLYYQYGFQIYASEMSSLMNDGTTPYNNQLKEALNFWRKPGDITPNPRRFLNNFSDLGTYTSTRYLYDGDELRLQNITLSYQFPTKLISNLFIRQLRIYAQGNNLKVWSKYKGADPNDLSIYGSSNFAYPSQRSYSLGINASF